jgi:phosphoesterase RecJ-like protein
MTPNATFSEIESAIRSAKSILVASHLRPDADALGSTLAMTLWIQSLGIEVAAWNEDGLLDKFRYLPESHLVTKPEPGQRKFDLLVALDTSVQNRLGKVLDAAGEIYESINIDHHVSNERFGGLNHINATAPATGEILADFFTSIGAEITPAMAGNLFAAISTDTGSFQYQGTTPHTFEVAAGLIRSGVQVAELSRAMYENMPRRRLELLRHALNDAVFIENDRVVSFALTMADATRLGVLPEDNEGIIDHLRAVNTVEVAVFFEELPEGKVRVSARSKDLRIDVCRICQQFGGGGHPLASGARIRGSLDEVREKFLKAVVDELTFHA